MINGEVTTEANFMLQIIVVVNFPFHYLLAASAVGASVSRTRVGSGGKRHGKTCWRNNNAFARCWKL